MDISGAARYHDISRSPETRWTRQVERNNSDKRFVNVTLTAGHSRLQPTTPIVVSGVVGLHQTIGDTMERYLRLEIKSDNLPLPQDTDINHLVSDIQQNIQELCLICYCLICSIGQFVGKMLAMGRDLNVSRTGIEPVTC